MKPNYELVGTSESWDFFQKSRRFRKLKLHNCNDNMAILTTCNMAILTICSEERYEW